MPDGCESGSAALCVASGSALSAASVSAHSVTLPSPAGATSSRLCACSSGGGETFSASSAIAGSGMAAACGSVAVGPDSGGAFDGGDANRLTTTMSSPWPKRATSVGASGSRCGISSTVTRSPPRRRSASTPTALSAAALAYKSSPCAEWAAMASPGPATASTSRRARSPSVSFGPLASSAVTRIAGTCAATTIRAQEHRSGRARPPPTPRSRSRRGCPPWASVPARRAIWAASASRGSRRWGKLG